jgi:hypothetical protein
MRKDIISYHIIRYYGPYMPTEVNAIIEAKGTGGRVIKE